MEVGYGILILFLTTSVIYSMRIISYDCCNPNNKLGLCISLYACPTLLRLFLNSTSSPDNGTFLQQSYCKNGFGEPPFVCCINDYTTTNNISSLKSEENDVSFTADACLVKLQEIAIFQRRANLPATWEQCTTGTKGSSLANFYQSSCFGSLINDRYILTSASCAQNAQSQVIIGGKTIVIEAHIPHEKYIDNSTHIYNIGLARLSERIQFSIESAPSCLPSAVNSFKDYKVGDIITIPTRGEVSAEIVENCLDSEILQNHFYAKLSQITYLVLSAGIPLTAQYNGTWVTVGINAERFIYPDCLPFVRVSEFEDWIISKIIP